MARRCGRIALHVERGNIPPSNRIVPPVRLDEADQRAAERRLAATRLADEAERFAGA